MVKRRKISNAWMALAILAACLFAGVALSQMLGRTEAHQRVAPQAELHMARVVYNYSGGQCRGYRGGGGDWWCIDYPEAERHILPALDRMTRLSVSEDSYFVELSNENIFDYPWLFMQQVGQGRGWSPTEQEAAQLREYLLRGGFLIVDDFHGEYEWETFQRAIRRVFPDRPVVDIPDTDMLMNILFNLDARTQIPGERHVSWGGQVNMDGPPHWRGIYDDNGNLMVAINHNIDMGDAWEHADDARYPAEMTATAYRFGINYIIYAMTH